MVVDIPDVVTYTNFGDHRLGVFFGGGGQIFSSPIDFHCRPYNTLALPCERVILLLIVDCCVGVVRQFLPQLHHEYEADGKHELVL